MSVRNLEPQIIWNHFEDLNAVPRPSKREERVRKFMMDFGKNLGLEVLEDAIGNVIIKKPATAGMEDRETIILQAHIDMVHQKNADTEFDFETEGIQSYIDGDWVTANGTTLGADNGMGVAAAMSLLSSTDIPHPALEGLFTIDEETGMTGAKELDGSLLQGKILMNLDTEDDDEFSVGCAGGIDTNTSWKYEEEAVPAEWKAFEFSVTGLKGGHSGMDIHLGRGNSNKLMNRIIYQISNIIDLRICDVEGGGLRNAIPRESFGIVVCSAKDVAVMEEEFNKLSNQLTEDLKITEPELQISFSSTETPGKMMTKKSQEIVVAAIYTTPHGVWQMSEKIPGLVETSTSLAKVIIRNGEFIHRSLQRSMSESGKEDIANAVRLVYEQFGASVEQTGDYPGWAPNPDSKILSVLKKQYTDLFNEEPKVAACHAGLECGILSEAYSWLRYGVLWSND